MAMTASPDRREARVQRRRAEMLDVAKAAFLSRPYSEVTVEEIAAGAGLSKATVYLYFSSKAEIYGSILERDMRLLGDALQASYRPERALEANLLAFGRSYVAFFRAHPEYFSKWSFFLLPGRESRLPPTIAERVEARFAAAQRIVEDVLRAAAAQGLVRIEEPWRATAALWSMWLGATYLASLEPGRRQDAELEVVVETGIRAFLQGVAAR